MKKPFFTSLFALIFLCTNFILFGVPVYSQQAMPSEKIEYLYLANKEKVFVETVDEFYLALRNREYPVHQEFYNRHKEFYKRNKHMQDQMDTALFKKIPHASVSVRKKLLMRQVERFNYITWDGNILRTYPDIDINYHQAISPDRQVYFFYSFKDTEKEFRGRYAIYDVETKQMVAGGGTYMPKYPTYREQL